MAETTAAKAKLSSKRQLLIALQCIRDSKGAASMQTIYTAIEAVIKPDTLSKQGKASLRRYINSNAVRGGLVEKFDRSSPGWKLTPKGLERLASEAASDVVSEQETPAF